MRQGTEYEGDLGRYLEPIRALPFVAALDWTVAPRGTGDREIDAEIKITTPRRKFKIAAEFKRTYMDRATLKALIAKQAHVRQKLKLPLLDQPTIWFHEVFHPDGKPYREREANLIHSLTGRGATIF